MTINYEGSNNGTNIDYGDAQEKPNIDYGDAQDKSDKGFFGSIDDFIRSGVARGIGEFWNDIITLATGKPYLTEAQMDQMYGKPTTTPGQSAEIAGRFGPEFIGGIKLLKFARRFIPDWVKSAFGAGGAMALYDKYGKQVVTGKDGGGMYRGGIIGNPHPSGNPILNGGV